MDHAPDALVLDFVEWIAAGPRRYCDVMEAWRTSCPRLTIWEDAIDQGLVQRCRIDGELSIVTTEAGRDLLAKTRQGFLTASDYRGVEGAAPLAIAASSVSYQR
jgi:hypothetical protein